MIEVAWLALLVILRRSHTIEMKSKVHPTYKTKYRVSNWPAYNRALVRRSDVTVWFVLGSDRCLDTPPERPAGAGSGGTRISPSKPP